MADKKLEITEQLFEKFLVGRKGLHVFIQHDDIVDNYFQEKIRIAEHRHGFSAWQRNVGIVTTPVNIVTKRRIRAVAKDAGYLAYISNEEIFSGADVVEYCEILLTRVDVHIAGAVG